jgi:pyruvate/2-oxoacid:ferredoxin oxidoreductase beta subunit
MKLSIPEEEYVFSGHLACQGCGATLCMRYALKALGQNTILDIPACCWSVIDGPFPHTSVKVPLYHTAFETAACVASGIRAGLDALGKGETNVVAWAGDGGTFDIGIQALSGAAERNDNIIYICYDNEAYMNTGIQRSSATPYGAWTTTTPVKHFKKMPKKDLVKIMAAHRIPYTATACVSYPEDFVRKVKKARDIKGTKFLHIMSPCPPGWKSLPEESIKLGRLAVSTCYFPIYEIENGEEYTVNKVIKRATPVKEFLKRQGRFRHLTEKQVSVIQENVLKSYNEILRKAGITEEVTLKSG